MIKASDLATVGCRYLGTPYSVMDCQKFVERCMSDLGLKKDLAGSNTWYREMKRNGWVGTPKECKEKFGYIPKGAFLYILKNNGKEPEKYKNDGIGNADHIGIYTGLTGQEMVEIAKKAGNEIAGGYNYGNGAINSSSSHGAVCTSTFNGTAINGGWNRIGLWTKNIDYGFGGETEMVHTMIVSTPDGGTLNMRKQPNSKAAIITQIPNGTPVNVIDEAVGWKKLEYEGKDGWVMAQFLAEPSSDPQGQVIVPKDELQKMYDTIGDWLGLRG